MDDLVRWLGEQLDEDERIAKAAAGMKFDLPSDAPWERARLLAERGRVAADERHIAEWDPARVLREIDAKRKQIAWCVATIGERNLSRYGDFGLLKDDPDALAVTLAVEMLRLLALPYVDRPGYLLGWAPTD